MTTGRINQVCLVLPSSRQSHETMVLHGSAAKVQRFASHVAILEIQALLSELKLTTWHQHTSLRHNTKAAAPKQELLASTQKAVCYQAVAQYPESFSNHKVTLRHLQRSCHCTCAVAISSSAPEADVRSHENSKMSGGGPPNNKGQGKPQTTQFENALFLK